MNVPFGIETSEKWFIELWNYTILPYLNDIVKMKLILSESSQSLKLSDPVEWLVSNYPWPKNTGANCGVPISQRLFRLKLYDNYLTNSARSSSSDESDIQNTVIETGVNNSNNNMNSTHHHLVSLKNLLNITFNC